MTAVPSQAVEAAYTRFCEREHLRGGHRRDDMMAAILAALPALREGIAAEVLNHAADAMDQEGGWETPQWWLRDRAEALSAPVQAAEEVGGDGN